jgi:DNA-directed RNA polymerase specialized sigma54-like protein
VTARRYICKRRGCSGARELRHLLCADCWALVPQLLRKGYLGARRRRLTRMAKIASEHILKALGPVRSTEPNGPAAKAARAYARTAAQQGDRTDWEAAE